MKKWERDWLKGRLVKGHAKYAYVWYLPSLHACATTDGRSIRIWVGNPREVEDIGLHLAPSDKGAGWIYEACNLYLSEPTHAVPLPAIRDIRWLSGGRIGDFMWRGFRFDAERIYSDLRFIDHVACETANYAYCTSNIGQRTAVFRALHYAAIVSAVSEDGFTSSSGLKMGGEGSS